MQSANLVLFIQTYNIPSTIRTNTKFKAHRIKETKEKVGEEDYLELEKEKSSKKLSFRSQLSVYVGRVAAGGNDEGYFR